MKQNYAALPLSLLLLLLASISAISPLAIDLYLPAMPKISSQLATNMSMMQNTLSIYLFGYALGLFIFGPQADKRPRRQMVIVGISGFILMTLIIPFATSIEQFLLIRFCQAFISSAAIVTVPGTIKELFGKDTAKGLSYVSMMMMLAPMIAPAIGSALMLIQHWQLIFFSLAGYAFVVLIAVWQYLPNAKHCQKKQNMGFISRYKIVLGHQRARLDLICSMMVSLAFFAYITAIPAVYLSAYQLSEFEFSILFGITVFALMIAHFINAKLVVRKGSRVMLNSGVVVGLISASLLVLFVWYQLHVIYVTLIILPLMTSISMVAVNADALVLLSFKNQSGTATAVIGVLRFGVGSLAGPILAFFYNGTAMPFSLLMWGSIFMVCICQLAQKWKIGDK